MLFAAQLRSRALALNSTPASPRKVPEPIGSPAGVYHSIVGAVIFLHIVIFHLRKVTHFANIKRRDKRIFAIALKYFFGNRKHKFAFEALFGFWHKLKRLDKAKIVKIVRKCKRIIK